MNALGAIRTLDRPVNSITLLSQSGALPLSLPRKDYEGIRFRGLEIKLCLDRIKNITINFIFKLPNQ